MDLCAKLCLLLLIVIVLMLKVANAGVVRISNTEMRRDVNGQLMDIHDGNIVQWQAGGPYFWYGMGYGDCKNLLFPCSPTVGIGSCGFRTDHKINIYRSTDLVSWTYVGEALPMANRPKGIYFRPKVIFNARTQRYALWVNLVSTGLSSTSILGIQNLGKWTSGIPNFWKTTYLVATSPTPEGPFVVRNERMDTLQFGAPGDFALIVNDDEENGGVAYIAYDAFARDHQVSVEQLTDDFLATLGPRASSGIISTVNNEAPVFFRRNGLFYLVYGQCCCFCHGGANAKVLTAKHPLGPWVDSGNDLNKVGNPFRIAAQPSFVISVPQYRGNGTSQWIWVADRWGSAPDGLKSHDLQYWQPLKFNDSRRPPWILPLEFQPEIMIDL